jgi:antitoxin (DNA-binding transcriptional repressor) of toxin-antitoxin stability system
MHYYGVQATLTDLRRKTGRVLGPVIHAGQTVEITAQSVVVATIQPKKARRKMSRDEIRAAIEGSNVPWKGTWQELYAQTREP